MFNNESLEFLFGTFLNIVWDFFFVPFMMILGTFFNDIWNFFFAVILRISFLQRFWELLFCRDFDNFFPADIFGTSFFEILWDSVFGFFLVRILVTSFLHEILNVFSVIFFNFYMDFGEYFCKDLWYFFQVVSHLFLDKSFGISFLRRSLELLFCKIFFLRFLFSRSLEFLILARILVTPFFHKFLTLLLGFCTFLQGSLGYCGISFFPRIFRISFLIRSSEFLFCKYL